MIYLELFLAFFKIGLFAIGGGLATVPFLFDLVEEKSWFSVEELVKMIAVSESTPGPLGINMATFTGIQTAGITGALIATFGLVIPMFISIIILSHFLRWLKNSELIEIMFEGMRPAVAMMILCFILTLLKLNLETAYHMGQSLLPILLFICYTILTFHYRGHPILFILLGATMGVICGI